jgi:5-methylcytosine-specific restriction endonuclease McrA
MNSKYRHTNGRGKNRAVQDTDATNSIYLRDKGACVYCGERGQVIDHVIPFSKGGVNTLKNLVLCCSKCNYKKKNKIIEPFTTMGIYHLMMCGQDMSWVDKLK